MSDVVVSALKRKLQSSGIRGIALDIDETLSNSNAHWFEHMKKFHTPDGMTPEQMARWHDSGKSSIPEWETEAARAYMREGLESNEFQEAIPLLHESNAMVHKLNDIIPVVAYISARPDGVLQGTHTWLTKHGFPEADIILRPGRPGLHGLETKNSWKAGVLKELHPEVLGIVDDNLGLPGELAKIDYRGTLFVYGPQMQELQPSDYPFEVITSPTWDRVLDHFADKRLTG